MNPQPSPPNQPAKPPIELKSKSSLITNPVSTTSTSFVIKVAQWVFRYLPYSSLSYLISFAYHWAGRTLFKEKEHYKRWCLTVKQTADIKNRKKAQHGSSVATPQEELDYRQIKESGLFNANFYLPPFSPKYTLDETICNFICFWHAQPLRKPMPGFNTQIYAASHNLTAHGSPNPFAHYLRTGKPQGQWNSPIIDPSATVTPSSQALRCALHIHVFYPKLLEDILKPLAYNQLKCDLFVSVTSQDALKQVETILKSYSKGTYEICIVPNRGRDIGPLLSAFNEKIASYDIIGHLHTKKSPHLKHPGAARLWFTFLIENLIGGQNSMADRIIAQFAQDETLGLVYPDDPYILGWGENKPFAVQLAQQMGLPELPDGSFSFPAGTMFWARPAALKPLFMLNYSWGDYPVEPLPPDGSMLHAIERLLPFVAEKQGFKKALTYVSGITH